MNVAVIFAGGVGQRMNSKTKPKQFLELYSKPIIIYTIEHFEKNELVDGIIVVCVGTWIKYLKDLLDKFHIKKVKSIVNGGSTGQQSIYFGLREAQKYYPDDSIVLIHDGVRPLINTETITNDIICAKKYGNAITVAPVVETIAITNQEHTGVVDLIMDRSKCMLARAPQCFVLKEIIKAEEQAVDDGFEAIDSAMLMKHYGYELHTVIGGYENIKITTPSDFYIFRAIMDARENSQIFG